MSITLLALVATLAQVPAEPPKDHAFRVGIVTLAAVSGADIATTAQAAERGGFREGNLVFKGVFAQPAVLGFVNGAMSAAVGLLAYDLHKPHPKIARWIVWWWAIFRGAIVIHNVRTLRR